MKRTIASLFIALFASTALYGTPAQVVLLRHAEKPEEGDTLSQRGFERAAALVPFFIDPPNADKFKPCAAVYAPRSSKNHRSTRSIQTVSALANAFEVPFYVKYIVEEVEELAKEIMDEPSYEGKMVLICWQHAHIAMIAEAVGVSNPEKWPKKAFDRVWVIDFVGDKVSSFKDLPQHLLPGDS
ncbi:MAG: histidine phosphatase family protein [Verrucomicrobia bacterium]|nr:histidine phosphatase family protein [Verrucomicrobiota bacterium]